MPKCLHKYLRVGESIESFYLVHTHKCRILEDTWPCHFQPQIQKKINPHFHTDLQKIKILSFLQIYFIIRIVTLKEIIKK